MRPVASFSPSSLLKDTHWERRLTPAEPSRPDDDDLKNVHQEASKLAGSSGSSELFSQIVGAIGQHKGQIADEDVDEEGTPPLPRLAGTS